MKKYNVIKQMLGQVDWLLVALVLCIFIMGLLGVMSTTNTGYNPEEQSFWEYVGTLNFSPMELQLVYFAVGLIALVLLMLIDYNNLREYSDIIYWVTVAMLVAVKLFGREINGTSGWFMIAGRGFQPAEFGKVFMIIVLAKEFAKRTEGKKEGITHIKDLWPMIWRFAIPFALIVWQPDFGSAVVYLVVFIAMMFVSKTSLKLMGIMFGGVAVALPGMYFLLQPYQQQRILTFINPSLDPQGAGMQVLRAKEVATSGGFFGKGLFSQELLTQGSGYLPQADTDFIFASITEAIGFIGSFIMILFFTALLVRMFMLASRAKDDFGSYLIVGVAAMFLFHTFENIGMNIGLMPVTGIPLPFVSYGGSNMLASLMALGLVLNVYMRRLKYTTLQSR